MLYPQGKILIFCKAPQMGRVKTRLAESIGEQAAAIVHEHLARQCVATLSQYAIAPVELWCSPDMNHDFFKHCQEEFDIPLKQQIGSDLGERMQHAARASLETSPFVVIVGTDCPLLSREYLDVAFASLSDHQTVIGPAEDGGYVLLGMREIQEEIFSDMPWGTAQVYAETLSRLNGEVKELAQLWDVDYAEDLGRLRRCSATLGLFPEFARYLNTLALP